jgi:hypothetical protein
MSGWWPFLPGLFLLLGGIGLTFLNIVRRSTPGLLLAVRLRFIGLGLLILVPGLEIAVSALLKQDVGGVVLGLFVLVLAGTWFYAASDPLFGRSGDGPPKT